MSGRDASDDLSMFFDVSLDMLCIRDMAGRMVKLSAAWETVLGYTVEELQGNPLLPLVHPDDVATTRLEMLRVETRPEQRGGTRGRHLARVAAVLERGEQSVAELRLDAHGPGRAEPFPPPSGQGPNGCRDEEHAHDRLDAARDLTADEAGDERRERPREPQRPRGLEQRERRPGREEASRGTRPAEQPGIERAHVSARARRRWPAA